MKPAFILHSPENHTDYHLFVVAPDASESPGPWPVVLFMDGDDQFSAAVDAYRAQRKTGAVPPLLLVGVGYGASYSKPNNRRGRDYTPTAHSDEPTSGGWPAMSNALSSGSLETVELLLMRGADLNGGNWGEGSNLDIAKKKKRGDMVQLLRRYGAHM